MATKRPYVVKIKTHRGWTNRVTGAKYRKGKTYEKRFGDKSVKALRIWHQDKDYRWLQELLQQV